MALSERTKDFLFNCHEVGKPGRKDFVSILFRTGDWQDVIDDLLFEYRPESFEEMVYDIINDTYYNTI